MLIKRWERQFRSKSVADPIVPNLLEENIDKVKSSKSDPDHDQNGTHNEYILQWYRDVVEKTETERNPFPWWIRSIQIRIEGDIVRVEARNIRRDVFVLR